MSPKIVNCPPCGKILSPDFLEGTKRDPVKCPACGSYRTVKDAKRYAPTGVIQRYRCKDCVTRFSEQ